MEYTLNNARIEQIPCGEGLEKFRGKIGFDLFSAAVVNGEIRKHAKTLGIPDTQEYAKALGSILEDPDSAVRQEASQLVDTFSKRLALCLYNMKMYYVGVTSFEDALKKKDSDCLLACKKIIMGGGLAAGRFGEELISGVNQALEDWKIDLYVERFPYPQYMPLLGGASLCPEGDAVVFDFGQSFSKGASIHTEGETVHMKPFGKVPSKWVKRKYRLRMYQRKEARLLDEYIQSYICDCLKKCAFQKGGTLPAVISLAAKMKDGALCPFGAYGKMETVFPDYREHLEKALRHKTGYEISLRLTGDQTAAALAVSASPDTLIVTIGTAFAIQEPLTGVRRIDADIQMEH